MFTGLIEEIGKIKSVRSLGGGKSITVTAKKIMDDVKIDDSVAINGACQTVVTVGTDYFEVEAVEETLSKTTLGAMRNGMKVNLERAAKVGDRLGGHIVQGHIDTTGTVKSIEKQLTGILVWVEFPIEYSKYAVQHGSICIDGVSLTIARLRNNMAMLSVIPHTWDVTTLAELKNGSNVNIEFDIIGKYIENFMKYKSDKPTGGSSLDKYITQPDW
ncbi:MAG: riboflavin synthase [Candidatus Kapabacteria bacterium]|nr:riboflavin synthase [Ignavibacteriota bacterium]MCW5884637.1 riboflavin synthase [Candidatus Kapabacteria bacterium]